MTIANKYKLRALNLTCFTLAHNKPCPDQRNFILNSRLMNTTLEVRSLMKTDTVYVLLVGSVLSPDYITSNGRISE